MMTLALKSFCPGFGAFSVDTRYCLITVVCQKALVIVGTCNHYSGRSTTLGAWYKTALVGAVVCPHCFEVGV